MRGSRLRTAEKGKTGIIGWLLECVKSVKQIFSGGGKKIFFGLLSDIKRLPYLCRRKAVPHLRAGEKGTPCNSATVPAAVTPFVVPKRLKTTAIKLFAGRCSESGEARKPAAFGTSALASGATPR